MRVFKSITGIEFTHIKEIIDLILCHKVKSRYLKMCSFHYNKEMPNSFLSYLICK